jgi:hypothetical protein
MSIFYIQNYCQLEQLTDIYSNPDNYLMPHKAPIDCLLPTIAKYMYPHMVAR